MTLLLHIIEACLGLVIISAFIPVFQALNADFDLIKMLLEIIKYLIAL